MGVFVAVVARLPSAKICNAVWLSPGQGAKRALKKSPIKLKRDLLRFAVWLSPGCQLLVVASGTQLLIWNLPDLDLVPLLTLNPKP